MKLAAAHLVDLQARIAELQAIAGTLAHLVDHCRGDGRPHCPILGTLASDEAIAARARGRARSASARRGLRFSSP